MLNTNQLSAVILFRSEKVEESPTPWGGGCGRGGREGGGARRSFPFLPEGRVGEQKKMIVAPILPILMYGAELHLTPLTEAAGFAASCHRWITGAWRGSNRGTVADRVDIQKLGGMMWMKRIRWAASAYGRIVEKLHTE